VTAAHAPATASGIDLAELDPDTSKEKHREEEIGRAHV